MVKCTSVKDVYTGLMPAFETKISMPPNLSTAWKREHTCESMKSKRQVPFEALYSLEEISALLRISHVTRASGSTKTLWRQSGNCVIHVFLLATANHHCRSFLCKTLSDRKTDANQTKTMISDHQLCKQRNCCFPTLGLRQSLQLLFLPVVSSLLKMSPVANRICHKRSCKYDVVLDFETLCNPY